MRRLLLSFCLLVVGATFSPAAMSTPAYASPSDLADAYTPQLVSEKATGDTLLLDFEDAGSAGVQRVQRALGASADTIRTALTARYGTSDVHAGHPVLAQLNLDGAWLWLCRHSATGLDEAMRDEQKRHDRALADLASGRTDLGPLASDAPAEADPYGGVFATGNPRLFGRAYRA